MTAKFLSDKEALGTPQGAQYNRQAQASESEFEDKETREARDGDIDESRCWTGT